MALGRNVIKGGVAALMVMVMTAGAFAWTASATTSVNVRNGPGTQFRVVDVLQRNQLAEVDYCRGSWCFLSPRGSRVTGWVSSNYLREVGHVRQPQYRPAPPRYRPAPPPPPRYHRPDRPRHDYDYRPPRHDRDRGRWDDHRNPRDDSQVCFDGPNGYFCFGN
ncbi:SH3 domain-containing protein [Pelagibacterium montanilacus]|uniref:SH3 domain-containing protein n=1 Tax=Pelagibacterium montanilacus TaxID=2185280 RepID=UPI000F8E0F0A|nr:SH3 domain-containing protein [Pelagibacterium montanilacus]